jgi:hypothetical protein
LIGKLSEGGIGAAIDTLAIIATAFGVAISLGLGALQINGGLNHMFGISINPVVQVVIIGIVTILFLISATSGLARQGILSPLEGFYRNPKGNLTSSVLISEGLASDVLSFENLEHSPVAGPKDQY